MGRLHRAAVGFAAPAGERRAFLGYIPDGYEGTRVTLEIMRQLVRAWRTNPELIALSRSIIEGVQEKNFTAEAEALHEFVRDSVRYTQDVNEVETVQAPNVTLESGHGDCDDKSTLLAAMLESVGHPSRFVAIGFAPDNFDHVYVETLIGRDWIAADSTEQVALGWEPQGYVSKMIRHI